MGLARVLSVALAGVQGTVVEVEAHISPALPSVTIVGLPDAAVSEARDRVRAAALNSREDWPMQRITVGLYPATVRKAGSGFDLAIAAAVLLAAGAAPAHSLDGAALLGELGLDGRVRRINGVLPAVLAASAAGVKRVVVPHVTAAEAALVPEVEVLAVRSLGQLMAVLRGEELAEPVAQPIVDDDDDRGPDLLDVIGQAGGRRALEVAAAGGHHLLLLGSPGCGKTMLAERLPGILPPLSPSEGLEVAAIHSVAGALPAHCPVVARPPFRAPHHSASMAALVGGGSGVIRPGAASLAHRGVLFLDEAPEFHRGVLDALRQPLESGQVEIARAQATARFPARFTLVLAANPCPCARGTDMADLSCQCTPLARQRYLAKLSGPLLDRVDLRLLLPPVSRADLLGGERAGESSSDVAARVRKAREQARQRFAGTPWRLCGDVPGPELNVRWPVPPRVLAPLHREADRGRLTARGMHRTLRVAWTLADLAGRDGPDVGDVAEALQLRAGVG
jgi:magnesium chelatase family protein